MREVWLEHRIPRVFVNMKKEIGDIRYLNKLVEMFNRRELEISYNLFINFLNPNYSSVNFDHHDYDIIESEEKWSIKIKNWLMIPALGILKMIDDYKNDCIKQGWELCPYASFSNPGNEKAYTQIDRDEIRAGEWEDLFKEHSGLFTSYDKNYELKNWNAFLTYNGVKYFYFVQNLSHLIVEKEKHWRVVYDTRRIFNFLYSSNPIDLITVILRIQEIRWNKDLEDPSKSGFSNNDSYNHSNFKIVYKQILLKEDSESLDEIVENKGQIGLEELIEDETPVGLHFPVVLPTYAIFNDNFKYHLEQEYPKIVNFCTSEALNSLFPNPQTHLPESYEESWNLNPEDVDIKENLNNSEFLQNILASQIKSPKQW
jgi:hypothetical protein